MTCQYKRLLLLLSVIIAISGCIHKQKAIQPKANWCDKKLRPELKTLEEIKTLEEVKTNSNWFKVYNVGHNVYALMEPYNYQEVISYLILGDEKALLFDTGMGLDSISPLVKQITPLPVTVLNSHTHYDHMGGNYEFDNILAINTDFTKKTAANGWAHAIVKAEVTPAAFCLQRLPKTDTANYRVKPFKISKFIADGYILNLGNRKIKVIATPGHAPNAIALLDAQYGYLWTGDTFYLGPIWLFSDGTDLDAYGKSIKKLALLAPGLQRIFPSHNLPVADPNLLVEADKAFTQIRNGTQTGTPDGDKSLSFKFDKFSYLIRTDLLSSK